MFIVSDFNFSFSSLSTSVKSSLTKLKSPHQFTGGGGAISLRISSLGCISLSSEGGHQKQILLFTQCITVT